MKQRITIRRVAPGRWEAHHEEVDPHREARRQFVNTLLFLTAMLGLGGLIALLKKWF